jgi:signal transduction histidine kinase/ligand-binding sensor domain-containing protein/DNA-binding response OmpR family regulator
MANMRILQILLLINALPGLANDRYNKVNLTNNDGLSNSSVNVIFQDTTGLMWFGTWDGLNMYNGRDFKTYKPAAGNAFSISNNIIRNIVEENENILWVATDRDVDRWNRKTNRFEHFFVDTKKQTPPVERSFLLSKNNSNRIIAYVYEQGLFYFDNDRQQFITLDIPEKFHALQLFFDVDDNLWVYTTGKLLRKIIFKKGDLNLPVIENIITFKLLDNIESVFYNVQHNEILMQNTGGKLFVYAISEGLLTTLPVRAPGKATLTSVSFFDDYQLWGTNKGLFSYDMASRSIDIVLPHTQVLSLCKGSQQIVWVGSDMQGVYMLSPLHNNFRAYTSENGHNLWKNAVRCFLEAGNMLYVGTKGDGIFMFEQHKHDLQYKSNITTANGLLSNSVFTMVKGHGKEYWMGSDGRGLNYLYPGDNKMYTLHIPQDMEGINLSSVYAILPAGDNTLWVGTSGYGMYRLEINRRTQPYSISNYKQYSYNDSLPSSLSNNIVYSIIADDDRHLWIGTRGGGLNYFDTQTETFKVYRFSTSHAHYISNDDILCLHKDRTGTLWVGTSMGLNKLERPDNSTPAFTHFTEHEGIPNNTIHGILEDAGQNLWISTNRGIAKLVRLGGQYRIISYFKKDGLQNNEFSDGAYYKSPRTADLYFGGISGFNVFNPLTITGNSPIPPLALDAFYIRNVETNLYEHIEIRKGKETLVLPSQYKSVSFKFVPLDFLSGAKCEIAYMLEGFDSDWIHLGLSSTIVLSNLPKGNYTLKVRCSNADKIWSDTCFSLPIVMLPPWWNSGWAYLSYFVLLLSVIYVIRRQIKYRLAVKENIRAKEQEKQKIEEIHQAKLRFFTNIAHEFSNSLTLIYAPCEQLLIKLSEKDHIRKYVNTIRSNSQRMQSLIQELIEFRKAETGFLKINIEPVDIAEFIKFVADNFIETLSQKKITFHLDVPQHLLVWNTDRHGLEKILFNLVSNAAKYTPAEQTITITAKEQNENLCLEVTNTGVGIQNAYKKIIFDRFKVLEDFETKLSEGFETRNGVGLALSKSMVEVLGGTIDVQSDGQTYTTFVIRLPRKTVEQPEVQEKEPQQLLLPPADDNMEPSTKSKVPLVPDNTKSGLVLVIDDDKEIRRLLNDILADKFEVMEAGNGKEGIEAMKIRMPAVIVCDVIMPNMNGVEFVRIMKSQELTRHIPIVLLSGKSSIESQIEGIETGADAYLPKPFHPRHLKALIESLLGRNKAVTDYNKSHYAAMEAFQGKLIHKEDKALLLRITQIIQKNIDDEDLSLEYIAKEIAISRMQLYRKIKELTEQTPTEFIRSLRLEQAEKLLKTTNHTVQEIMYGCGFNNKAYFYREFYKKYQYTPKEYRKSGAVTTHEQLRLE